MSEEREHMVVLTKNEMEQVVGVRCGDCQGPLETPVEYHPVEFCLLVKAGHDPIGLVQRGSERVPKKSWNIIQLQTKS